MVFHVICDSRKVEGTVIALCSVTTGPYWTEKPGSAYCFRGWRDAADYIKQAGLVYNRPRICTRADLRRLMGLTVHDPALHNLMQRPVLEPDGDNYGRLCAEGTS